MTNNEQRQANLMKALEDYKKLCNKLEEAKKVVNAIKREQRETLKEVSRWS